MSDRVHPNARRQQPGRMRAGHDIPGKLARLKLDFSLLRRQRKLDRHFPNSITSGPFGTCSGAKSKNLGLYRTISWAVAHSSAADRVEMRRGRFRNWDAR